MPRSPTLTELSFVVVGAKNAGKSTFIRCAFDMKRLQSSSVASKKMSLEGEVFLIRLVELPLQDVDVADNAIIWPHRIVQEAGVSHVDGVLALYDATEQKTLSGIPNLLNACSKTSTPCVLVSCKCDATAGSKRAVNLREIEKDCMQETGIESCQTMQTKPETHKRCISVVLRSLKSNNAAVGQTGRQRAQTATQLSAHIMNPEPSTVKYGHIRAASEVRAIPRVNVQGEPRLHASEVVEQTGLELDHPNVTGTRMLNGIPDAYHGDEMTQPLRLDLDGTSFREHTRTIPATGTPTTIANSFLERNGDSQDEVPLSQEDTRLNQHGENDIESHQSGFTFDELVDRLLAQPMSKADSRYVSTFLCLYRKFAAPAQLLSALLSRFENLPHDSEQQILRISSQLRQLSVLARWTAEYPGDFAHSVTRSQIKTFVGQLADNQLFATAASEMQANLDVVSDDDDTLWLYSDQARGHKTTLECFSIVPSLRSAVNAALLKGYIAEQEPFNTTPLSVAQQRQVYHSKASSSISSTGRSESLISSPSAKVYNSAESAQRQAELLTPISRNTLSKLQWHQFMEFTDDCIARELTRIDWIMYSAMKPRDLIRHVSLTPEQKERCKSLEHVNRMINQFNHVAFWVANMVLLRDKAKHRAKALEKFMGIAWKLRQLNNYNSLGAVIAGINGTAVHRLAQTRELVSTQARRDFMRLEILMGTQRSHFAYRLAWENTLGEKIPFLPLHRRDLVSAEEGNRTLAQDNPDKINWKKFDVMGDTIIGIQKSQGTPYTPIQRDLEIQRLILDSKFSKDDDELYERSMQVEGPVGNEARRRFNWFQR